MGEESDEWLWMSCFEFGRDDGFTECVGQLFGIFWVENPMPLLI